MLKTKRTKRNAKRLTSERQAHKLLKTHLFLHSRIVPCVGVRGQISRCGKIVTCCWVHDLKCEHSEAANKSVFSMMMLKAKMKIVSELASESRLSDSKLSVVLLRVAWWLGYLDWPQVSFGGWPTLLRVLALQTLSTSEIIWASFPWAHALAPGTTVSSRVTSHRHGWNSVASPAPSSGPPPWPDTRSSTKKQRVSCIPWPFWFHDTDMKPG